MPGYRFALQGVRRLIRQRAQSSRNSSDGTCRGARARLRLLINQRRVPPQSGRHRDALHLFPGRQSLAVVRSLFVASVCCRRIRNFCEFDQDGPVAALSTRKEVPRKTIASPFVLTGLFHPGEPAIDLHIFASHTLDVEAPFESFSKFRARSS